MRIGNSQLHLRHVRFVGPSGVGKSTAVRAASAMVAHQSGPTAVPGAPLAGTGLTDFGEWHSPNGPVVSLLAASGLEVPDVERLGGLPRAGATVLWLFGDRRDGFDQARLWLGRLGTLPHLRRLTVAVTRMERATLTCPSLGDYESLVWCFDRSVPVLPADPRRRADVEAVLHVALRGAFPQYGVA